jgi:hypothetical protein
MLRRRIGGPKRKDFTGLVVGKMVVLERGPDIFNENGQRTTTWQVKCECGVIKNIRSSNLKNAKSCGCGIKERAKTLYKFTNPKAYRTGTKNISKFYFNRLKHRANKKQIEFKITIQFMQELLEKQNFKCALSGEEITLEYEQNHPITASLDRIDSFKGYLPDNVQWVHKEVNFMKINNTDEKFFEWCRKIIAFQDLKNQQQVISA